ncbi:hypothetical protein Cni_G17416 [Canna indica]|uniref:DUF1677 family protein n=1 Tax=Canna indica TaxID=4628 RepID=A0AAQ3KKL6_9LILI|nr:hypothetical protein Cni_G17416 [Canna indica]
MAARAKSRRLSLDLFQRAVSDLSANAGILGYMDLRAPSRPSGDVSEVRCECCGLSEDCTHAYVSRIRDRFCGRWVCGLCSEAVKEEHGRLGLARHIVREEALTAHMDVCRRYNKFVRTNPAMSLAGTMSEILKKSCKKINDDHGGRGRGGN